MSAICTRFSQNAWKKDLCSNCFKSKDEHKTTTAQVSTISAINYNVKVMPNSIMNSNGNDQHLKGIMKNNQKNNNNKSKKCHSVSFQKELTEIIGYGGEWGSDDEMNDNDDNDVTPIDENDDLMTTDDEERQDLIRLTKVNTNFNMNNGNLLGNAEENIKKSFAALRLGTPQVDSNGKRQTLKISVTPFGTPSKLSCMKAKFELNKEPSDNKLSTIVSNDENDQKNINSSLSSSITTVVTSTKKKDSIKIGVERSSPPIERAMGKSLLEEISETLEQKKEQQKHKQNDDKVDIKQSENGDSKVKLEIMSLSSGSSEIKKSISRSSPVTQKSIILQKYNSEMNSTRESSNSSEVEEGMSAYYDVVDSKENNYENIPDGQDKIKEHDQSNNRARKSLSGTDKTQETIPSYYSNSQYTTDMLLSSKTRSASYSVHEGNFMLTKVTSDGLVVTKCSSDDALDSTGSSFEGSSDDEMSYNMNRSESDSGIGISIRSTDNQTSVEHKTKTSSNNNSDYEDIQVSEIKDIKPEKVFPIEKSRELAGEPDGSADPDGNNSDQLPALPKTPPPINTYIQSVSTVAIKKPEVPVKPAINLIKTFGKKPSPPCPERNSTQSNVNKVINFEKTSKPDETEQSKILKKTRAPNPPSQNQVFNVKCEEQKTVSVNNNIKPGQEHQKAHVFSNKTDESHGTIYTRNTIGVKTSSPVIREKDKRERATVNPKFRSLNTFNTNRKIQSTKSSTVEEPMSRRSLSISEECLVDEKKKKSKFSIRKFLRMGSSKTTDHLQRKDGIYSEMIAGDEPGVNGKPRLVIIHPIDINPMAVEVIKEIKKPPEQISVMAGKPPVPPLRSEFQKPAKPPPPKSAELRRRQKTELNINPTGSVKSKSDNVYANLGEIRLAIAPRKPERTASMREREAQLELAKKKTETTPEKDISDTISACSSNTSSVSILNMKKSELTFPNKPENSFLRSQYFLNETETATTASKEHLRKSQENIASIGIENKNKTEKNQRSDSILQDHGKLKQSLNDELKNSVLKINSTIDSYLKNKRDYEALCNESKCNTSTSVHDVHLKNNYEMITIRQPGRNHLRNSESISAINCSRSEYGSRYGLNRSFANIPQTASYCGSELGESSDIYYPYSFYGSEMGDMTNDLNENIWGVSSVVKSRGTKPINRLRMRKGRSVIHKTIEDNYSAVTVANHEALAQVLDQLQQSPIFSPQLRSLANAINLRFEDFSILEGGQPFVVGKRAFHAAVWANVPVTLVLSADCNAISGVSGELNQLSGGVSGVLNPITEFCDLVPNYYLPLMPTVEVRMLQATISVLPRMQLDTLQTIGSVLKLKTQTVDKNTSSYHGSIPNLTDGPREHQQISLRNGCSFQNLLAFSENAVEKNEEIPSAPDMSLFNDIMCREVAFIMLQLVNGLKNLQSKAIEEMPQNLSNVILCKEIENKDAQARLCVLQSTNNEEDEPMATLCKCAYTALTGMLPLTKITPLLSEILLQEKSETLSKAKSVLEYIIWGPSDVALNGSAKEQELALQRWLDLERATVLHGLVRSRVELTVYDECHLMFLVRSNAKIINEAAKIVSNFENCNGSG